MHLSATLHSLTTATILLLTPPLLATPFDLPPGPGPFSTLFSESELLDRTRPDPFTPSTPRRLMISRFDPIPPSSCTPLQKPYMSPLLSTVYESVVSDLGVTLPVGFFTRPQLSLCEPRANSTLPSPASASAPNLIILSPGNGGSRLLYSALAQALSSRGATVLVLDHPSNAAAVEFPNGDVIFGVGANYTFEQIHEVFLPVHAADISFLLDHFGFADTEDARRVVVVGHSLGGATAMAALPDRRIRGVVNLDGMVWGAAQDAGVGAEGREQAVVLWQQENLDIAVQLESWARFESTVNSSEDADFFARLELAGTRHYSFLDGPLVFDAAGLRDEPEMAAAIAEFFGTVSGERLMLVLGEYLDTFVKYALGGDDEVDIGIYEDPPEGFEDVHILG